jgi:hypothetical protein
MVFDEDYDKIFGELDEDKRNIIIERDKRMTECFRRVFSTDDGKRVLHQLLLDLEYFNYQINSPQETALNNYAKFMIFKRLGCNNDKQISDAIFNCNKH